MRFSNIFQNINSVLETNKTKQLTVHSCFVTVLHLANEKGLKFLKNDEDFLLYQDSEFA